MAGGYSRSPVPRSLTSALERLMVSSESMMKWTRSSCSTHSCKLGGRSMGVSRSMFTNRVATYSQRTGGLIYSPKVRQAPPEPQQPGPTSPSELRGEGQGEVSSSSSSSSSSSIPSTFSNPSSQTLSETLSSSTPQD